MLAGYLRDHADRLSSAMQARIAVRHLTRYHGERIPTDLTDEVQQGYVDARHAAGVKAATISREISVLRAALRYAAKRAPGLAVPVIYDLPAPDARARWLRRDEV